MNTRERELVSAAQHILNQEGVLHSNDLLNTATRLHNGINEALNNNPRYQQALQEPYEGPRFILLGKGDQLVGIPQIPSKYRIYADKGHTRVMVRLPGESNAAPKVAIERDIVVHDQVGDQTVSMNITEQMANDQTAQTQITEIIHQLRNL